MSTVFEEQNIIYRTSAYLVSTLALVLGVLIWVFANELAHMVDVWETTEEFSYGYLIPVVVLYLIWQKRNQLASMEFEGSWFGIILAAAGVFVYVVGELSTIYIIGQYAFLIIIYGVALALMGARVFRVVLVPLLMLMFMIPIPQFILGQLSAQFQLMSSELGVAIIRMFNISVFLEGNVIDLGSYKLQVVEACSGLRYLFPLMVFGFILAYFYQAPLWKRALIFLSTIPLTICMNSVRIGVIGVTVEYWGVQMAEGFLHDFEGWGVFMVCTVMLVGEMWLLTRLGKDKRPLGQVFGIQTAEPLPDHAVTKQRAIPSAFNVALVVVAATACISFLIPDRTEIKPDRENFANFPMQINGWTGRNDRLEQIYIDALKFTDYMLADYTNNKKGVNFYVAYYDSQRGGASVHSPRSCMPGGGWKISSLEKKLIHDVKVGDNPLFVNRAIIELGDKKQVVYYWFQQRGRVITNEYLVKWYLFWDAFTKSRSDGSLVRVTSAVSANEDVSEVDMRLTEFVQSATPYLDEYIPN